MTDPITLATQAGLDPWGRGTSTQRRIKCPIGAHAGDKTRGGYACVLEVCGEKAGVWYCNKCKQGGTLRGTEGKVTAPMPKPTTAVVSPIDLARVWARIPRGVRATEALVGWAAQRGWPADVAQAFARLDDVRWIPEDAPPRDDEDLTTIYYKCRNSHFARPVLFAIRDEQGRVVNAMRRCVGEPTDDRGKTLRLPSDLCPVEGALILGSLPQWLDAALAGEPVYVVEGEPDFAVLSVLCGMRGWGAVIGAPSAGALEGVARAAVEGLGKGAARAHVALVPHLGDAKDVGVVSMREAAQVLASAGATCDLCYIARRDTRRSVDVSEILEWGGMDRVEDALVSDIERVEGGPPGRPPAPPPEDGGEEGVISAPDKVWPCTDLGNAERMTYYYGRDLRYVHTHHRWYLWDGRRWQHDKDGGVEEIAKDVARRIGDEVVLAGSEEIEDAIQKHARKSESAGGLANMVKLTRTVPTISTRADTLDDDPWLLNCGNGTLDLRTGTLRAHSRGDRLTRLCPVDYDPSALCPTWDAFVLDIMDGRPHLVNFLRRAAGYSLSGSAREECLFFLYGSKGRNGKGTFVSTIQRVMGDHQTSCSFDTFLSRPAGSVRNDLAKLDKVHLVMASEPNKGAKLDEGLIKTLTGRDTITARFLYGEEFTFVPRFKLWLMSNHKPIIRGTDDAIWSRIRTIPFDRSWLGQEDRGLKERLLDELPGILAWCVRGCLEWQHMGLAEPDEVRCATQDYRDEMDAVGAFLTDMTDRQSGAQTTLDEMYEAWSKWCEDTEEYNPGKRKLGTALKERGYTQGRNGRSRWWQDVSLVGGVI